MLRFLVVLLYIVAYRRKKVAFSLDVKPGITTGAVDISHVVKMMKMSFVCIVHYKTKDRVTRTPLKIGGERKSE
jgi:hypothetical protein